MKHIILITLFPLLFSCLPQEPSKLKFGLKRTQFQQPLEQATISFAQFQAAVLVRCTDCHKSYKEEKGVLEDMVPGNPDESVFFQVLKDGSMPKDAAPFSTEELEFVRKFIENLKP